MDYKVALIFFILLLSFPAKVGGMFNLRIHTGMSYYIDIALANPASVRTLEKCGLYSVTTHY